MLGCGGGKGGCGKKCGGREKVLGEVLGCKYVLGEVRESVLGKVMGGVGKCVGMWER